LIPALRRRLRTLLTDAGVRATVASRAIALGGAPVTLYLAATRLAPNDQGWYFVAINIVAFAQLCELGLGTIIVQFASHEWPRLRWGRGGGLEGDPGARDSVAALLVAATRWFGTAALALFVIAGAGGVLIFGGNLSEPRLGFVVLWCGFVSVTALYLVVIPFVCVAEGCGDLIAVQRMRAYQAAAILLALWTGILTAGPLAAAWLAATAQLLVAVVWLFTRHRGLLRAPRTLPALLLESAKGVAMRYHAEQGRSARLWIALWVTPQLLAPVLLRMRGGDEAGRLGVTLAVATAPLTLAIAWLHGRYPSFGALVAGGKTREFDALARRAAAEAATVFAAGCLLVTGVVLLLPHMLPAFAMRFLPPVSLIALMGGNLAALLLQAMAGWLRAFRDEEIATPIVSGAIVVVVASAVAGTVGGAQLMAAVFAGASLLVAVPIAGVHFARVRRERLGAGQTS
jgi:preprotein translocase subunit Sec61beta